MIINPYAYAGPPPASNVKSLLHFDGTNGSTTFTDENGRTWSPSGTTQISTAESVFGGASAISNGSPSTTADTSDLELAALDFCIEMRIRSTDNSAGGFIADKITGGSSWGVYRGGASLDFYASSDGATWDIASALNIGTLALNTWCGVAVTRSGNTFRTFFDGTLVSTTTSSASLYDNGGVMRAPANGLVGYIDEFRLTVGAAVYTSSYTLAGSAFPAP